MEPTDGNSLVPRKSAWISRGLLAALSLIVVLFLLAILPGVDDSYTVRAQVSEGASLADGAKSAITDYFTRTASFPLNNHQAGIASPQSIVGNYVTSVTIASGNVIVRYASNADPEITGLFLVFRPHATSNGINWDCTSAAGTTVPNRQRPTICRP